MCGIYGYLGNFEASDLQNMAASMSHRGPDDVGFYQSVGKELGLAHNRLSIIDLSAVGHQPMLSVDSDVAITFNGEIYNYQKIRETLVDLGYRFISESDTEVVLLAYMEYGLLVLEKLIGIFSFAIWDSRTNELFIARDRMGVKPFYYAQMDEGFVFASELKAILTHPKVSREIDLEAVFNHISFLYSPGDSTLLKGVRKLEPGFAMIVSDRSIQKIWRYYDLPFCSDEAAINDEGVAISAVRDGLSAAVDSQLVSDVPVGAFLSGGLDSSAIVALAKSNNPDIDLQCYTMRLNGSELKQEGFVDDLPYAQEVAKHCSVPLNIIDFDSTQIFQLPKMIFHLDEPQADPAPLNVLAISELAAAQGVKVLLSGAGGDDLFTGYRRHYALQMERFWGYLPVQIRKAIKYSTGQIKGKSPFVRRIKKAFEYADLDQETRIASYFSWVNPSKGKELFSQQSKLSLQNYNPIIELSNQLSNVSAQSTNLQKMLYLEAKGFLPDHNLNYTDKMGMAAGVEIRVPFLDTNLVDIASRIPDRFKQNGREGKWVLKKSMEDILPRNVIYRPKTGFGAPLRYWMQNQLKSLIDEVLSDTALKNRGIFDVAGVRNMIIEDRVGKHDYSYVIFSILCIELWFKTFVDPVSPRIITL